MGIDKGRCTFGDRVLGRDNGMARIVGFMDFGEELESGGSGIGDMEK